MADNYTSTTRFKVDISELVTGIQQAKRHISLANAEFKSATAGMDDWASSADGVSAKLNQLDKVLTNQKSILSALEAQYRMVADEMGEDSKQAELLKIHIENQKASIAKTEKELRTYTQRLDDIKSGALNAEEGTNKLDKSLNAVQKSTKEAGGGFTVLKGAIASLVADGLKKAIEAFKEVSQSSQQASNIFQSATGSTAEAMAEYNKAIKDIYKNNFGDSLQDIAKQMAKIKAITGEVDASKLQELTEAVYTLEDTFDMDLNETIRGAQALMTHFGLTAKEAMDFIATGAQQGLDYTNELGDNLSEYSGKFAEAGYSVQEYFQLLQNGAQGGAYNLDKVNDAINEVTARLADGTIEGALSLYSSETQELFKAWQSGRATQKQVIDAIVKDIQNTTNEQEKMNMSAKAFGTMAEDGGVKFISSLTSVGNAFDSTSGKMEELKQVRYDDVMTELQSLGRTLKMDLLAPLAEMLLPAIKETINFIIDNKELFAGLAITFGTIAVALGAWTAAQWAWTTATQLATAAQWAFNAAMNASPLTWILTAIGLLVTAFITLWNTSEEFRNFWIGLWDNIKAFVGGAIDAIVGFFTGAWDKIKQVWGAVTDWFNQWVITPLKTFFTGAWDRTVEGARMAWDGIKAAFAGVRDFFVNIFSNAWEGVKRVFSTGGKIFEGIKDGLLNGFKWIVNGIIDGLNWVIAQPFKGINWALEKIKGVSILGFKPFDWIQTIPIPEIPKLAKGGVVDGATLAMIGEAGREAVIPLENNMGWLDEVARRISRYNNTSHNTDNSNTV